MSNFSVNSSSGDYQDVQGAQFSGAGLSVVNTVANWIASEIAAERQYKKQLEFWNMQNSYNSPFAQRQRLAQAGMTPNSDNVSSMPAGELSSVPRNEAMAQGGFDLMSAIKIVSETEKMGAETDFVTQQLAIAVVEEAIKKEEFFGVKLDNDKKSILLKWLDAKEKASLDKLYEEINYIDQQTDTSKSQQNLNEATKSSLESKLPYEIESLSAGTALKREESLTEQYKREYYTASSANQRSMAVKNYADARLTNIKADIESVYGALQAKANLNKTELEAQVIMPLADALIGLQDAQAMLAKDNVRHNAEIEAIQKEANRIQECLYELKNDEYVYGIVKDSIDMLIPDANHVISSFGSAFGSFF